MDKQEKELRYGIRRRLGFSEEYLNKTFYIYSQRRLKSFHSEPCDYLINQICWEMTEDLIGYSYWKYRESFFCLLREKYGDQFFEYVNYQTRYVINQSTCSITNLTYTLDSNLQIDLSTISDYKILC